jgi:O-antigen/teichoic acid export membrane protein
MLSGRLISSAIPALIARLLTVGSVTYYSVTQKVLDYAGEGIGRIGLITAPRATDWMARGYRPQLLRLAEYGNKYCLTLWLVIATWLFVYRDALFRIWINPDFADKASVLLAIMLFGYTFWLGQFVSASILMGIAKYGEYSASLMVEAILTVLGFGLMLPHYGLAGGVAVSSLMIFCNRCLNLSRIFAKQFEIPLLPFLSRVYFTPIVLAIVDIGLLFAVRNAWIPGRSWRELFEVGAVNSILWIVASFWLIVDPEHRELFLAQITARLRPKPVTEPQS